MNLNIKFLFLSVFVALAASCNVDDVIATVMPPNIVLDSETGIYTVKQGREITIAPSYESADGAKYEWIMGGEVLGTSPSLSFVREASGIYYITLSVVAEGGSDKEEIRVDVVDLEIPTVSIAGSSSLTMSLGAEVGLTAAVRETSIPVTFGWSVNGTAAGSESVYKFVAEAIGSYTIVAKASNEDGFHSDTVKVEVLDPSDIPFEWEFERTAYHTVKGRKLHIAPIGTDGMAGDGSDGALAGSGGAVSYTWEVEGVADLSGQNSDFVFVADAAGEYKVRGIAVVDKGESQISLTREFVVTVYDEGAFYRQRTGSSKANWNKVYEYTPAPGQFINELKTGGFDGTQTTPQAAVAYAESRMSQTYENGEPNPIWVSLGGFGGYIVVGFDHSIDNSGDYDLGILGNSFNGSSEPGIVWVMQDENGNGLPDDNWYELAGSETGKVETLQNYSVTYYRPTGAGMPVQWTDNQGNSGEIDYLKTYHSQDYYYPLWIESDSYTLTGTCLKARNYDASGKGSYWVNDSYDWGYVDNWSPVDRQVEGGSSNGGSGDNANADANANHFKICNAIDFEGKPVDLKFVDFVKVQVGVNAKSGWLGEISTEVFGFYDYNMKK